MKNLTVIIPVYNINSEAEEELFRTAISSVDDSKVIVIGPHVDIEKINKIEGIEKKFTAIVNPTQDTTYSNQVNIAVKEVKTEYFSVLEYDDIYTNIWFNNLNTYINKMGDDVFGFFPLTEVFNDSNPNFIIGYANEAVWASSFSEEIGFFDLQSLEDYYNFNCSGAVFKTSDFIESGMLKPSIKVSFWYEFLMRVLYRGKKLFVIPKVGYIHRIGRKDSLAVNYGNNMDEREYNWWLELAKKEYFFPHDRNKTYTQE